MPHILPYTELFQETTAVKNMHVLHHTGRKVHLPACSRRDSYSKRQAVASSCSLQLSLTLPFIVVPFYEYNFTENSILSFGVI